MKVTANKKNTVSERSRRYDSYKDSGVEWLRDIPEHWEIRKLKSFLEVFGRIGFRGYTTNDLVDEGSGAITISPSNFGESNLEWTKNSYLSWDKYYESPEIMVEVGDLLIVKTASIGKIAHVRELPEKATVNPQILVVKNVKADNRFLFYQFLSIVFQTQLMKEKIGSTIYTISENKILNGFALLPPLPEQTAIAQFLDDKTTKIDQAIAIKQQQIALLKERKQILIHKAVTKGVTSSAVEMKDSGVEWIGEIPEHWEVKRLKFVTKLISEKILSKDSSLNYIGMENIESWSGKFIESDSETEGLANYFEKSDILFGKLRPYLAKVYLAKNKGICTTEFLVYRTSESMSNLYTHLLMLSFEFINLIDSSTYGSKMPRANSDFIGNQLIPIPPLSEQKEIANYIETASSKIETAISLKEQEISKLQEYKSSLINSVVTGKVRVC
ncbi:hypothetical protein GCM10022271_11730 [Corallibacter vietnamensis]|uniref:Type I restriction modification DNA specificity domain-containing protein n=1 Tax=Corallibacter vietnamensis TaxID=904130 RepID=A0ABP7H3H0_9FLAO